MSDAAGHAIRPSRTGASLRGRSFAGLIAYQPAERERAEALIAEHYDVLIRIARAKRRRSGLSDTVSTVDLLHEAYVRIGGKTLFAD
ncbi:MAG: hypothetical protein HC788_15935, partial [Sphingopyxis sp.]|nr:hypothetical protein [Sphingopyxis sp.]